MGTYVFDGTTQDKLYEDLHAMVQGRTAPTVITHPAPVAEPVAAAESHPVPEMGEPTPTVIASSEPVEQPA